jgi:hypothetical protein
VAGCRDVRQCGDVDYTGNPVPVQDEAIGDRPLNSLEQQQQAPQDLLQPPTSSLPPDYPRGDVCATTGGIKAALPDQFEPRETNSGNTKWGLFAHPEVRFRANMDPLAIGGESALDFSAGATFKAGAYVWGEEIEALEVGASATILECKFGFQRTLELCNRSGVGLSGAS